MIGRPWLASTMSGALLLETASFSVVWRSVNDFACRLIFTFGYFARNAALRRLICAAWPPRTSWSQMVSVTGPALATSTFAEFFFAWSAFLELSPESPPGVPQPASTASAASSPMHRAVMSVSPFRGSAAGGPPPSLRPTALRLSRRPPRPSGPPPAPPPTGVRRAPPPAAPVGTVTDSEPYRTDQHSAV